MTVNNRPVSCKTRVHGASSSAPRGALRTIGGWGRALVAVGAWWLGTVPASRADGTAHHVAPPPPQQAHAPFVLVEIRALGVAPIARDALCPSGASCVFGPGVGVGASVERRSSDRFGMWAGYDVWLLDSGGVYELGTVHSFRGGVRHVFDDVTRVHPFVSGGLALLAFGDTAGVRALGAGVSIGVGAELEISEAVALVGNFETWAFGTEAFTSREGVRRAAEPGVNVALQLSLGVSVLLDDAVARGPEGEETY